MHCQTISIQVETARGPETVHAIVCGRQAPSKRCVVCQTTRDLKLCDFPLHGAKAGKTCDRPVCATHAAHEEPDTDYCPSHARVLAERKASPRDLVACPNCGGVYERGKASHDFSQCRSD